MVLKTEQMCEPFLTPLLMESTCSDITVITRRACIEMKGQQLQSGKKKQSTRNARFLQTFMAESWEIQGQKQMKNDGEEEMKHFLALICQRQTNKNLLRMHRELCSACYGLHFKGEF